MIDRDLLRFHQRKLDVVVQYSADGLAKNAQGFSLLRQDGQPRQAFDLYVSGQIIESADGNMAEICTEVDTTAFYQRFIQVINQG